VVLVGDAAHGTTPNLGQGACQAIESAWVLAEELSRQPPAEAFAAFEAARMHKARFITRTSWRFGQISNLRGPLGRFIRHTVLPRTPKRTIQKQMDRIFQVRP
jgi:2-polyprenyl-6-methoxyphenol hydroxylase-like FAD-dependent oxidoreductase